MSNFNQLKFLFENNGYVVLRNFLKSKIFFKTSDKILEQINNEFIYNLKEIKKLGGYLTGNLDLVPSIDFKTIWNELVDNDIGKVFKEIIGEDIQNYDVTFRGNVSLPKKGDQFYHTDGPLKSRKILIGIAIKNIELIDGPTVLIPGSHKKQVKFWKFYSNFFFKKKKKLTLKRGDIFFRESHIWHKGSRNRGSELRTQLLFVLKKKNITSIEKNINFNNKIKLATNMFGTTLKEKFREFISVYLPFLYIIYQIFFSIFKN